MKVIYEPKGRAKEYADLAVNLYNGCSHGCEYCYAPQVMHKTKEDFFGSPAPRKNIISLLKQDIKEMVVSGDEREVLLCFSCDPYQPIDCEYGLTRDAVRLFSEHDIKYSVLTKGGKRSERDFDLMEWSSDLCRYGTTLVFSNDEHSMKYEPKAAPTSERIDSLRIAHEMGIPTWVSFEPVWNPADFFWLLGAVSELADEVRIGKLNYHPHAKEINWKQFKVDAVNICEKYGINYKLKNDLAIL